jgi:hypothetical protein
MILIEHDIDWIGEWSFAWMHTILTAIFFSTCFPVRIEACAFAPSSLAQISTPRSVERIREFSFSECNSLCQVPFEDDWSLQMTER